MKFPTNYLICYMSNSKDKKSSVYKHLLRSYNERKCVFFSSLRERVDGYALESRCLYVLLTSISR